MNEGLDYLDRLPADARYLGSAERGEIEIVPLPGEGASLAGEQTGVVYEDAYVLLIRDAVRFPSGVMGTYIRLFPKGALDGPAGVVVVCERDGLICLRYAFRHATRRWELELPRGGRSRELSADAARREVAEETGFDVQSIEQLGEICADTGLISGTIAVFWAAVARSELLAHPEPQEAFGELVMLTPTELEAAIRDGRVRDGITLAAISLARSQGKFHA